MRMEGEEAPRRDGRVHLAPVAVPSRWYGCLGRSVIFCCAGPKAYHLILAFHQPHGRGLEKGEHSAHLGGKPSRSWNSALTLRNGHSSIFHCSCTSNNLQIQDVRWRLSWARHKAS